MTSYKIMHKTKPHFLLASGCWSLERAKKWIDNFDPKMWMDKTMTKEDLMIVDETTNEEMAA